MGYALLAKAQIAFQLDIACGDVVTPCAEVAVIPVYLNLPAPELNVYPVYSVVAEKFHAMVTLGIANSRTKDFYDLLRIAQLMKLEGNIFRDAIIATFNRRGITFSDGLPFVFSQEFSQDKNKQLQ